MFEYMDYPRKYFRKSCLDEKENKFGRLLSVSECVTFRFRYFLCSRDTSETVCYKKCIEMPIVIEIWSVYRGMHVTSGNYCTV